MKKSLILIISVILFASCSHDPKSMIVKSYEKCQSINSGYYEMDFIMKYISKNDTASSNCITYFEKLSDDSLFRLKFNDVLYRKGEISNNVIYNGEDLITAFYSDSSAIIYPYGKWDDFIMKIRHNYNSATRFFPVTSKKSSPFNDILDDSISTIKFYNDTIINGIECHHISAEIKSEDDPNGWIKMLKNNYEVFINTEDLIPIRFSNTIYALFNGDTVCQFDQKTLTKYDFDKPLNDSIFTIKSLPSLFNLIDYQPKDEIPLLNDGDKAPDWTLPSVDGNQLSLSDFKGKVVILDFFYKSCAPCMMAMPRLQDLYEKYSDKGLVVIGIDNIDTKEDMQTLMSQKGITYPIALEGKEVTKQYHISGYPTMYFIDKEGNIFNHHVGYGNGSEKEWEKDVKKLLGIE